MTDIVITLGSGKGTWTYLVELIKRENWTNVIVVTNAFGAENFTVEGKQLTFVIIDDRKKMRLLVEDILPQLKLSGTTVALNMVSGEGKLHMAVLASILKTGLGVRLVGIKDYKVTEL